MQDPQAITADARIRALQLERDSALGQKADLVGEVNRLNLVASAQQSQIAMLQQQLRVAQAAGGVTPAALVGSLVDAVDKASSQMPDRVVSNLSADLQVGLVIGNQSVGLLVSGAGEGPGVASTLHFNLSRLPPPAASIAEAQALGALSAAMTAAQEWLTRGTLPQSLTHDWQNAVLAISTYLSATPATLGDAATALKPALLALRPLVTAAKLAAGLDRVNGLLTASTALDAALAANIADLLGNIAE